MWNFLIENLELVLFPTIFLSFSFIFYCLTTPQEKNRKSIQNKLIFLEESINGLSLIINKTNIKLNNLEDQISNLDQRLEDFSDYQDEQNDKVFQDLKILYDSTFIPDEDSN